MKQTLLMILSVLLFLSCNKDNSNIEIEPPINMDANIRMIIGSTTFIVSLYDNSTADAILAMLPITMNMGGGKGDEKHADLPQNLPTSAVRPSTIRNGDLMLYGSKTLVLFYKNSSSSDSYTRVGKVGNPSALEATLGEEDVSVRFEQIAQPPQYTLTYNLNGATVGTTPPPVTADKGSRIALNNGSGFSRNGYTFAGWSANSNGTGVDYAAGSSYTLTNNITLYAKWNVATNSNSMKVSIGNTTFTATLTTGATATAFEAMLPLTLNMSDFNSNEKVCSLPNSLTTAASKPGTIHTGDIMLYGSNSLVLFYETFSTSYSYTRIGQIDNVAGFKAALGSGSVTVKFELE